MLKKAAERARERKGMQAQSLVMSKEEKKRMIPELAEQSRQQYLEKRGATQAALFRRQLEEDRKMFPDHELTSQ